MRKGLLVALAVTFCLNSFASTVPEKKETPKTKSEKKDRPATKETCDHDEFCSTKTESYWSGLMLYQASCTQCSYTQDFADIMAQNCAFEAARYASRMYFFAANP